jgi:ATP-binding cassette subfamily B protein
MQAPGGMTAPMEKRTPKDTRKIIKRLSEYVFTWKKQCVILIATILLTIACQLIIPILVQKAINALIYRTDSTFVRDLTRVIVALVFVFVANSIIEYIKNISAMKLSENLSKKLRKDLFERIIHAPLSYLDTHSYGDMMSRLSNDSQRVSTIAQVLQDFLSRIVIIVGSASIMLFQSWKLALVAIITAVVTTVISGIISGKMREYFMKQTTQLGTMNAHIEETMKGLSTVEMAGVRDYMNGGMKDRSNAYTDVCIKSSVFSAIINPIMIILGNLSFMITVVLGGSLTIKGAIGLGVLQAVIMYSKQFMDSVYGFGNVMIQTQSFLASAERVFEILDIEVENAGTHSRLVKQESGSGKDSQNKVDGAEEKSSSGVRFDKVSFSYDGESDVLDSVDTEMKAGTSTAIVGATGAGKTTLISLLLKFYDNYKGSIYVDGKELSDYTLAGIRDKVTVVLQDSHLMRGTIAENILYGTGSKEGAKNITDAMGVTGMIEALPDGFDTETYDDDETISEGMRQIIGMARALAKNPNILILDEALSSVDPITEQMIRTNITDKLRSITMILIAHRLDTAKQSDKIIVMKDGHIVEEGCHDSLMNEGKEYYRLYSSQMAGNEI